MKLDPGQWSEIQPRYEAGESVTKMAKEYGVTPGAISSKAKRNCWKKHGALQKEAVEDAREAIKDEITQTFKEDAERTIRRHVELAQTGQEAAEKLFNLIENTLSKCEDIYQIQAASTSIKNALLAIKTGIELERNAKSLDKFDPQEQDDPFESWIAGLKEAREKYEKEI